MSSRYRAVRWTIRGLHRQRLTLRAYETQLLTPLSERDRIHVETLAQRLARKIRENEKRLKSR